MGYEVEALIRGLDYEWDPNTGIFYVKTQDWPACSRCNLHSEQWIMDARKTYPCETAQHMRRILDKICEGYIEANTVGASISLDLQFGNVNEIGGWGAMILFAPTTFDDGEGGVGWSSFVIGPDVLPVNAYQLPFWNAGHTWTPKFCVFGAISNQIGTSWGPTPLQYFKAIHVNRFNAFSPVGMLRRGGATAIKAATINVEIGAGILTTNKRDYKVGEYDTDTSTPSTDLSAMKLRCIIVKDNKDGTYTYVGNSGLSPTGTLAPFVVEGITYYRGTLDCTALLKGAYDLFYTDSDLLLLFTLAPESATDAATSSIGSATDWIEKWEGTYDEETETTTEFHFWGKSLEYGSLVIGQVMVQFDKDYLDGGPNLHYDSTGHAAMPNLLYEP